MRSATWIARTVLLRLFYHAHRGMAGVKGDDRPQEVGFSAICRPFDVEPTFPAKATPRLPSRKLQCAITVKLEISSNEGT